MERVMIAQRGMRREDIFSLKSRPLEAGPG